jgi:hypothetical protein
MNKIELLRSDIEANYGNAHNLGDLISLVEKEMQSSGRVVCRYHINGLSLDEKTEVEFADMNVTEINTFLIESETPSGLLMGVLDNWINELPVVIKRADELSNEIKFKGIEGNLKSFVDLIDTVQFLIDSLLSLQKIINYPEFKSEAWVKNEILTAKTTGDALQAFETKDFVLLSEILEYDLGHVLQNWQELLQSMQNTMKEESEKTSGQQFSDRIFKKSV